MAVEIKELVIRAVLTNEEKAHASSDPAEVDTGREDMIQECVAQVLKVLEKKNRR